MNYQKINNITGWSIFAIATLVYAFTVERTASYWDCGEFIAVSYKLMVPHPPGAPFFLLIGRMFSFLAFGDVEMVAFWINMISVLSSGFAILFLFWIITSLGRKMLKVKKGEESRGDTMILMASGLVGALACTFADSFWFSATEAEVYGMSAFFTAFVVWAMLKWELIEDDSLANKWLILIAFMIGLSIGVHLLNLVTIPALALIYYFKKGLDPKVVKIALWGVLAVGLIGLVAVGIGFGILLLIIGGALLMLYKPGNRIQEIIITMLISAAIIGIIMVGIIPGLPTVAGSFEVFFVNSIGLPFGSGIIIFALIIIGAIVYGIYHSQKYSIPALNTALLCLSFILIGYSSYAIVIIRSNFDPPIDENNPDDIMSVVSYLKREQYGNRPLFYGQYFTAEMTGQERGSPVYTKGNEKYEIKDYKIVPVYDPSETTIFPRMYSMDPQHVRRYQEIMNLGPNEKPNFADNIVYTIKHQIGTMYMRYFLFNFSGRQSDMQNAGPIWLPNMFNDVPESIKANKGRNNYYMIPLILGIIGLIFQYKTNPKGFAFTAMLFFLTGIALILYLNSPPIEPRERDYIYAGSYFTFAIWIGFSVTAVYAFLKNYIKNNKISAVAATLICASAPAIMAAENWDDHDRSNRYFSVDSAKNFLASCEENAILFTGGDNDTFPLWYVQDVEGFRTDVRVVVLSYFNTDWYIEQMTRPVYESDPFPFSLTLDHYRQGGPNDFLYYIEESDIQGPISLKQYIQLIKQNHPQLKLQARIGSYNMLPSKTLFLDINKEDVIRNSVVPDKLEDRIVDRMVWNVKGNGLEKKDLAILDIIASSNWERPIYFNNTSRMSIRMDLDDYLIQEGQAYRLVPVTKPADRDFVNTEVMYDNLMNNFHYRELDNPNVYYNEDYRKFVLNHRQSFNKLANALYEEGDEERAREVILKSLELMPDKAIPYDFTTPFTIDVLFKLNEDEKALEIADTIGSRATEKLEYYESHNNWIGQEFEEVRGTLFNLYIIMRRNGYEEESQHYYQVLDQYGMVPQVRQR